MKHKDALRQIDNQIDQVKKQLVDLGPLRPGSISEQYASCGKGGCACQRLTKPKKHGPYFQISYFNKGKSKTEFLRSDMVLEARRQAHNYKTMRILIEKWIQLGLKRYRLIYKTNNKKFVGKS